MPYENWVRIPGAVLVPLTLLVPAATAAPAQAQKKTAAAEAKKKVEYTKGPTGKTAGACGSKILPLVEGNQWTYGFVASGSEPPPELAKLLPSEPGSIIITVKSIEPKGDEIGRASCRERV